MVFLLVEETKQRDLEDLDQIYRVSKRKFARYQATVHLPWLLRRAFGMNAGEKPDFYEDATKDVTAPEDPEADGLGGGSGDEGDAPPGPGVFVRGGGRRGAGGAGRGGGGVQLQDLVPPRPINGAGTGGGSLGPMSPPGSPYPPRDSGPGSPTSVPEIVRPGPRTRYE
jgi:hypothetical protein